jgi:CheY-like chemotaxis protein
MIEQVLLNLALNARDAMPGGGRLTIATSATTIQPKEAPESELAPAVCLRVTDTGIGMAPEVAGRIFEPFFTTKALNKGTGLGLTTVQGIVAQHLGEIRLSSAIGQGTTFEILVPACSQPAEPAASERPAASAPPRGNETILLVDDEPTLRGMMRMALKHFGYKVLEASSGRQALELFEHSASQVHLLLTDMVMPDGISGQELAEQMCARTSKLRVLYTSGYQIELVSRDLAQQEGLHFLQKPFSMQKLAGAVRECLDREPATAA